MAGQPPPQGPEDDFFDQFFSMAAGGSYPATAGGGRAPGDQPFSLALSLDAAAAEASGSGKHADGGKVVSAPPSCPLSPFLAFRLCTCTYQYQTRACACVRAVC